MSKVKINRGFLFAIEGIDGAGKSTQIMRLGQWFEKKGLKTVALREPTDGPYGQQIRDIAKRKRHLFKPEEELELFIQDRIEDCEKNIQPALHSNALVFIDRYYYSNIAYQGALGLDPDMIRTKNEAIAIRPDIVFILDVPVESGLHRIKEFRKEKPDDFENIHYLEKVREIFLGMKDDNIQRIDATQNSDQVFHEIQGYISKMIDQYQG